MREKELLERAFAMPLTSPAYPPGPYRFVDREFLIITYRTDPEKLRALVPEPLQPESPLVKFEFIRIRRSPGVVSCGASPRSWRSPACVPRRTCWWARG